MSRSRSGRRPTSGCSETPEGGVIEDVRAWIDGTLNGPDGYFAPTGFASVLPLYHTALRGSFVLSMITGTARPAPFRVPDGRSAYHELIQAVRRASADEPAYWFYGTDPDNALSVLSWVRRCHYEHALDHALQSFETEPADEGGCSWLGLVGESRRWMLLHEYDPGNSFAINVHGPPEFCRAVAAGLGADAQMLNERWLRLLGEVILSEFPGSVLIWHSDV